MPANADRLRDTFLELVRIPSPSRRERAVVDWLDDRLASLGYEPSEDRVGELIGGDAGNLFVRVPATGAGPNLFLSAHVDTVETGETAIEPAVDGETVTSRGDTILGADDKAGVSVLVEFLTRLQEEPVEHGELLVAFTVAEEIELLGASAMNPEWIKDCEAGIALDHSAPETFVTGAPSKVSLRIKVRGVGGHAAAPEGRVNAAHVLATAMSRLPSGRLDDTSTSNLGVLRAGSRINVIPDGAYAAYEIRSHHKGRLDFHLKRALGILEGAVREGRVYVRRAGAADAANPSAQEADAVQKASVEVEVEACYGAYRLADDALPVQLMNRAIQAGGLVPCAKIAQGGSDANVLNGLGLPTVVMGCGMHGAHSARESADLGQMQKSVDILRQVVAGA